MIIGVVIAVAIGAVIAVVTREVIKAATKRVNRAATRVAFLHSKRTMHFTCPQGRPGLHKAMQVTIVDWQVPIIVLRGAG